MTWRADRVAALHRKAVDKFILNSLGAATILYFANHWQSPYGWTAYIVSLAPCFINAVFTAKNVRFTIGGYKFSSMSDAGRTARWTFNFLTNPLFFFVFPPHAGEAFGLYLLMALGAQFEIAERKKKIQVLVASVIGYFITLSLDVHDANIQTKLFQFVTFTLVIVTFYKIESLWKDSLVKGAEMQQKEAETRIELASLQSNAVAGIQVKTVLHEIDNLIQVMDFAHLRPEELLNILHTSIAQIKRVKGIVFAPLLGTIKRDVEVGTVLDDINFIIKRFVLAQFIKWDTDIDKDALHKIVSENEGSLYCMILNIVKNCCEALQTGGQADKRVGFHVKLVKEMVVFEISDNGPGMTKAVLKALTAGQTTTSKGAGRGLGMRFVRETCDQHDYQLKIFSEVGKGTRFTIACPVTSKAVRIPPSVAS